MLKKNKLQTRTRTTLSHTHAQNMRAMRTQRRRRTLMIMITMMMIWRAHETCVALIHAYMMMERGDFRVMMITIVFAHRRDTALRELIANVSICVDRFEPLLPSLSGALWSGMGSTPHESFRPNMMMMMMFTIICAQDITEWPDHQMGVSLCVSFVSMLTWLC